MGLIDSIFNNETVKKAAFSMVKKVMTENNAKVFVISFAPDGELDGCTYPAGTILKDGSPYPYDVIVVAASQMDRIQQIMEEQDRTITRLLEENAALYASVGQVNEQPEPGPILATGDDMERYPISSPKSADNGSSTATT